MTLASLFFSIALFGLVGLYVARPLLQPRLRRRRMSRYERLLAEKEEILYKIQTLDFDYETGKLPESTYQQQREILMSDARALLIQLDEVEATGAKTIKVTGATLTTDASSDIDNDIELAVTTLRKQHTQIDSSQDGREPVTAATFSSKNGGSQTCSSCGNPLDQGDKFCAFCGHAIKQPQPHEHSS
jgi:hypothetical protein